MVTVCIFSSPCACGAFESEKSQQARRQAGKVIRCELILKCENVQGKSKWNFVMELKLWSAFTVANFRPHFVTCWNVVKARNVRKNVWLFSLVNRACQHAFQSIQQHFPARNDDSFHSTVDFHLSPTYYLVRKAINLTMKMGRACLAE